MSADEKPLFTPQEISHIEKHLGDIIFDWAKHLINNILTAARAEGVDVVYINSSETVHQTTNDKKQEYFYEKLPPALGFSKVKANLRGKPEKFWAYDLNKAVTAQTETGIPFDKIPPAKQGMFIHMFGRKPMYTREEVTKAVKILQDRAVAKASDAGPTFFYDWKSKTWNGAQRFRDDITENVITQKVTRRFQDKMTNDPIMLKFWSYVLSQHNHFGPDVIGFALLCRLNKKTWLVNQIQTDCINKYFNLR